MDRPIAPDQPRGSGGDGGEPLDAGELLGRAQREGVADAVLGEERVELPRVLERLAAEGEDGVAEEEARALGRNRAASQDAVRGHGPVAGGMKK